jgi:hypothetical protein
MKITKIEMEGVREEDFPFPLLPALERYIEKLIENERSN